MTSAFENLCGPQVWRVLAKRHDLLNRGESECDLNIDVRIVTDLLAACRALAGKVDALRTPSNP